MVKLQIKNMVCPRCIMAVENILAGLNASVVEVRLGEVILQEPLSDNNLKKFKEKLENLGFELLDDKNAKLINEIKTLIINMIQKEKEQEKNLSELISKKLNREYSQLSKLFSATEGITIEQFTILQKIEKVKELLIYDELALKEIAFRLGYSSTAHLSGQFKKMTGLSPTEFKNLQSRERKGIDSF